MRKAFFKRLCSLTLALALVCSLAPAALASTDAKGHWDSEFATLADAHEVADLLNIQMMCEGMVLLKNGKPGQPVLPLDPAKDGITMLGAASYNVVSGGMGSGAGGGIDVTMQQSLRDAGFKVNPLMERTYADLPQSMYMGAVSAGVRAYKWSVVQEDPACVKSAEYSLKNYRNVIWTLSRVGCEGSDGFTSNVPNNADPSKHFLQLSDNEEKMLAYLTELKEAGKIDSVTVMIGSANVMEMGPLQDSDAIDCIFWLGQPGPNGLAAVGKLLSGEANPSGKTVDIWNANHKADPTWFNFGDNTQHDSWAFNEEAQKWEKLNDEDHPLFNNNAYADGKADTRTNTLEYEEDVYLGYKWYETACVEDALRQLPTYDAAYASEADPNGYYNRGNGVVYPFGYGLSYTTFAQEFVTTADELAAAINEQAANGQADVDALVNVQVKVTNTGDRAGKEVVELYVNAPYTKGGIEKPYVSLVSFAKTELLAPGESETVTLRVRLADVASFDFDDANQNGYKGYEIEAGEYSFRIQENSHVICAGEKSELSCALNAITLDNDETAANNTPFSNGDDFDTLLVQKAEGSQATMKRLSRADFVATFPTAPTAQDRNYGAELNKLLHQGGNTATHGLNYGENAYARYVENMNSSDDLPTDPWYKTNEDLPEIWEQAADAEGRVNGKTAVQLNEMAGLEVDSDELLVPGDPFYSENEARTQADAWNLFMNQLTYDEMVALISAGSFHTEGLASVGKNRIEDADGPAQLGKSKGGYTFCCEVNIASTWNVNLAYARGYLTGHDSLFLSIGGWYGPAMNTHRSAFGGRNFEYYSQDGVQGGLIAAADCAGFQRMGGYSYIKHYALNDQETNRGGLSTWASEQAIRENYLKVFEYAIKELPMDINVTLGDFTITADKVGGSLGIMTSYNRIGAINSFCNYHSKQTIARDEWGFKGQIVTDAYGTGNGKGNMLMRTGGSIALGTLSGNNSITGAWDASLRDGKGGVRDGLPAYTASTKDAEGAIEVTADNLAAVQRTLPEAQEGSFVLAGDIPESATQYFAVRKAAEQVLYVGANSNVSKNGLDESLVAGKTVTVIEGDMLNEDFAALFGDLGSVSSYSTPSELPQGVSLTAAGVLTGRPAMVGTYNITVNMKTQLWVTTSAQVTLVVTPLLTASVEPNEAGQIVVKAGEEASITFSQSIYHLNDMFDASYMAFKDSVGRITDINYSLVNAVPGLKLAKDGTLSGIPTEKGTYELIVRTTVGYPSDRGRAMKADFDTTFTLVVE